MKSEKFIDRWREKREKGKKHYVLRYGILGFGVGLTCIFTIFEVILNASLSSGYLVPRILILPVLGIFLFSFRWESLEIKYAKLMDKNQKESKRTNKLRGLY